MLDYSIDDFLCWRQHVRGPMLLFSEPWVGAQRISNPRCRGGGCRFCEDGSVPESAEIQRQSLKA